MSAFTPKFFTLFKNGYVRLNLRSDAIAGLTVAIVALPLAMALAIASSQVKDFLGLSMTNVPADFIPKWVAYFDSFSTLNLATLCVGLATLCVGLATLLLIIVLRRFTPKLPHYLIAVSVSAIAIARFGFWQAAKRHSLGVYHRLFSRY